MTGHEPSLVERLSEAGSPRDFHEWEKRDDYYVETCRITPEDIPGLIELAQKWSDPYWLEDADRSQIGGKDADLLPVTAWRALGDLKAASAVEPLVGMLRDVGDEFDDWTLEELPHVFGKIGIPAIEPLTHLATNEDELEYLRSTAIRGLRQVVNHHADTRDRIAACLTEMFANTCDAPGDHMELNTTLLAELVELRVVEAAEPIERAFAANQVDCGMLGDWECVRRELGVEGLGLTMPEHPHNSLIQLQSRLGIGIFSHRAVFNFEEIDEAAANAYLKQAEGAFSNSIEARQVIERHGDLGWFRSLLEFGLNYLGESIDEMTLASVQEFVLDYVPRKVAAEAESAESVIDELAMFWEFLDRVYELPAAMSIVEWLRSDGLVTRLKAEMSDPENFGMAKSIFMSGRQAGYDMTSEADVAQFAAAYNRSLSSYQPVATSVAGKERVGRNAPCPCGSGKKFKKCCGR